MNSYSLHYRFEQALPSSAEAAFDWCTDYRPDDWSRMGKKGTRKIRRINQDTLILTDTVEGDEGPVTKKRLVRLDRERLMWTNTHLAGPNRHSQFWYRITPVGRGKSKLEFVGHQVNYGRSPSETKTRELAEELRREDSGMWRLLAEEMRNDLDRAR